MGVVPLFTIIKVSSAVSFQTKCRMLLLPIIVIYQTTKVKHDITEL